MSARDREDRDRGDVERLVRAHANRDLTAAEVDRLARLVAADPVLDAEVEAATEVHRAFGAERLVYADACEPTSPREEADPQYQRLQRAAAAAGERLRSRLERPWFRFRPPMSRRRVRVALAVCAAAALTVVALVLATRGDRGPELLPNTPDGRTLGGVARIVLDTELRASDRHLSWHAVLGAAAYEATIDDDTGRWLARRAAELAPQTHWQLDADEFARLADAVAAGKRLVLRIVARDGAGVAVGTTGDLPLRCEPGK
jgi:hypothetical protein